VISGQFVNLALGLPLPEIYTKHPERENAARAAWLEDRKRQTELEDRKRQTEKRYTEVLQLYSSLIYADPKTPRGIPLALARAHGLFSTEIAAIEEQAQEAFFRNAWESYHSECRKSEANRRQDRQELQEGARIAFAASKLRFGYLAEQPVPYFVKDYDLPGKQIVRKYMLLHQYPSVAKIFEPYYTARFAPPWKDTFPDCNRIVSWMLAWVRFFRERSVRGLEYFDYYNPPPGLRALRQMFRSRPNCNSWPEGTLFEIDLLDGFEKFVKQYGEGAIVVLVLLMSLDEPKQWRYHFYNSDLKVNFLDKEPYNMLYVAALINTDPLDIFLFMGRLADLLAHLDIERDCRKYTWWCPEWFKHDWMKGAPRERFSDWHSEDSFYKGRSWTSEINGLEKRDDMQALSQLVAQSRNEKLREQWWTNSERLVKTYLMARACHIAKYGQKVADRTFPQPTRSPVQVSNMVAFMVQLLEEDERQKLNQRQLRWFAEHETRVQEEFDQRFHNKPLPPPAYLAPRVLSAVEIEVLKAACIKELRQIEKQV
jgi:hypothetical protein